MIDIMKSKNVRVLRSRKTSMDLKNKSMLCCIVILINQQQRDANM